MLIDTKPLAKLAIGSTTINHGYIVKHSASSSWKFSDKLVRELTQKTGFNRDKFIYADQTHSSRVKVIQKNFSISKSTIPLSNTDGIITNRTDALILIKHADCVPIFLYDKRQRIIGLIHSGWKGTLRNIGNKGLKKLLNNFHTRLKDLQIIIGPSARKCCYISKAKPQQINTPLWDQHIHRKALGWQVDLVGYICQMFKLAGISAGNLYDCNICTICHGNYHSWTVQKKFNTTLRCGVSYIGIK